MITDNDRIEEIRHGGEGGGPVIYWMHREIRVNDNPSLNFASGLALAHKRELMVCFHVNTEFPENNPRSHVFAFESMLQALKKLETLNIPLYYSEAPPEQFIPALAISTDAFCLVTDFDPLKYRLRKLNAVSKRIRIPVYRVDSHNVVPCQAASAKQEFAAYTFRPKVNKLMNACLTELPALSPHPFNTSATFVFADPPAAPILSSRQSAIIATGMPEPGEDAALARLRSFISDKLAAYPLARNNPASEGQSGLSPYLHFGNISARKTALEIQKSDAPGYAKECFLEELVIRKELAENYCYHCRDYDNFEGFQPWAQKTLNEHRDDKRSLSYSFDMLESAQTHDTAWNAAQKEMVLTGKMHGYMRMYWAKKLLEWCPSPEEAQEYAITLNDRYQLDGGDPNGYAGIAWSIGGVHDRAWGERPVFGKIRYMNYDGLKRKFDVKAYEKQWLPYSRP